MLKRYISVQCYDAELRHRGITSQGADWPIEQRHLSSLRWNVPLHMRLCCLSGTVGETRLALVAVTQVHFDDQVMLRAEKSRPPWGCESGCQPILHASRYAENGNCVKSSAISATLVVFPTVVVVHVRKKD